MARLQISVLSCYPTVAVRGKANVTVWAFFGFSQLGGLGFQVGQITITLAFLVGVGGPKMFASGRFRRSYATVYKTLNATCNSKKAMGTCDLEVASYKFEKQSLEEGVDD